MKDTVFLVFDERGVRRMNKKYLPALQSGECMVQLNVSVPNRFFAQAIPVVNFEIPEGFIVSAPPIVATAEETFAECDHGMHPDECQECNGDVPN